jgi:hypothetical protein
MQPQEDITPLAFRFLISDAAILLTVPQSHATHHREFSPSLPAYVWAVR